MKTGKSFLSILILLTFILFTQCGDEDVAPTELLKNGNMEMGSSLPDDWFANNGDNNYFLAWNDNEYFSPGRSLEISTPVAENTYIAYWGQIISTDLPHGKKITLSVKIKGDLVGEGVSIGIRGDDTNPPQGSSEQIISTQYSNPISGSFDWTEYSVVLNSLDENIETITVYLSYLQNTTGEVYFDDAQLVY